MPALEHLLTSLQLRVLVATRAPLPPQWKVDEHVLPCNKIYYVFHGEGGYSIDGARHAMRPGHVALLPARHRNHCWHDPKQPFDKIWIHFDARVLGLVDLFDVLPCPAPMAVPAGAEIRTLLEALVRENASQAPSGPFRPLALNGLLSLALAQILSLAQSIPAQQEVLLRGPGDRVGVVLQHIAEHFADALTLESLATLVHLHPTYFSNTFRKATGLAPMAFLQRFRIERAKGLLASSDLPVMEVAQRVGFADPYHFSRVFKKLTGTPPTQFQESVRRTGER